jgi:hypothetical protein
MHCGTLDWLVEQNMGTGGEIGGMQMQSEVQLEIFCQCNFLIFIKIISDINIRGSWATSIMGTSLSYFLICLNFNTIFK